jgi:acyl-CoA reductase-like NAD-dependent aldehyde dehydrogenase
MSREETFGPVATITIVDDADEAVQVANQTSYGLSAGILTRRTAGPLRRSEGQRLRPLRRGEAMDEVTEMRWVTVQDQGGRPFPLLTGARG